MQTSNYPYVIDNFNDVDDVDMGETKSENIWEIFKNDSNLQEIFATIHGSHIEVTKVDSDRNALFPVPDNMIVVRWAPPSNVIFTNPDQDNKIKNLFLDRNWVYINTRDKKYKIKTRQNETTNMSGREFLRLIRIYFPGDLMYNEVMSCELAAHDQGFGTFKKVNSEWKRDNYCKTINSMAAADGSESKQPLKKVLNDFSTIFGSSRGIVYLNTCSPGYEFDRRGLDEASFYRLNNITLKKIDSTIKGLENFKLIRWDRPESIEKPPDIFLSESNASIVEDAQIDHRIVPAESKFVAHQRMDDRHELYHYIGKLIKDARETSDENLLKLIKNLVVNDYLKIMFYLSIPYTFQYNNDQINNFLASGNSNTAKVLIEKIKSIFIQCKEERKSFNEINDILLNLIIDDDVTIYNFYYYILLNAYSETGGKKTRRKRRTKRKSKRRRKTKRRIKKNKRRTKKRSKKKRK